MIFLESLAHFFKEMNNGSPRVQKAYIELLDALFTKRPEVKLFSIRSKRLVPEKCQR